MFWYFFWSSLVVIITLGWWISEVVQFYQEDHRMRNSKCFEYLEGNILKKLKELESKVDEIDHKLVMLDLKAGCGYRNEKIKEIIENADGPLTIEDFKDI